MTFKGHTKFFDVLIIIIILFAVFICLVPFLHVLAISLSSNSAILGSKVTIFPVELTFKSYESVLGDQAMIRSLIFTVQMTIVYTVISMIMTILAAYPLTKVRLRGRNVFLSIILFTMFFSGGIIPDYLLVKGLGIMNTMWALVLPGMISAFNLIVLKTFFSTLPESLMESAYLDGCNDFWVLLRIVLPLSMPVLATLSLFYAVAKWNSFQDALFYISKPTLYPLQLKLYQVVYNSQAIDIAINEGGTTITNLLPESLKAACVMFATFPIVCVYPWLQRHFIKGVLIGAIKG